MILHYRPLQHYNYSHRFSGYHNIYEIVMVIINFIVLIFGLNTKKLHFLNFELRTIMCIVKYLVSSDEAVPAKCLC